MKDSGIEWIGEIPEGWEVKPLKSLFSFGKGLPITKENLIEKGVPVISYGQIHSKSNPGTRLQQDLYRYVDKSYLQTGSNSLVHQGDFIFADTSEDLEGCGNCVYVDNETELFAGYHTVVLQKKESENNKYLSYLFKTDVWRKQIREKLVEVKLYSITRKVLKTTTVILPPKETQQKIATYLDEKCSQIEQTIQNQQQVIEKLKAYKQSLITEAVTGKVKIQNGKVAGKYKQYNDSGVEWIGEIPSGWIPTKIHYLTNKIGSGKTPNGGAATYLNEGILFIRSQNVYNEGLTVEDPMYISEEVDNEMASTRVFPNDVLLNITGGSIGRCCVFDAKYGQANVNQHVCIIRCNEKIHPHFMQYFWISKIGEISIDVYQTGGNREGMSGSAISKTIMPLPSYTEQEKIVEYLDSFSVSIDSAIEQKQKLIEKLTEYKKSLIYECVTGKKEIY